MQRILQKVLMLLVVQLYLATNALLVHLCNVFSPRFMRGLFEK